MSKNLFPNWIWLVLIVLLLSSAAACGGSSDDNQTATLRVGGIPDQDAARLARRYETFTNYLSKELGVDVEYVPSLDYAAVVTAFGAGDLHLAFFGGFTGVQARLQNPGSSAIAQREHDAQFHSRFIVRSELPINSLEDLKEQASQITMTFGSESSTSGHLMPRHFLVQAGIDPDNNFRDLPNFSGSHDLTWQLVESESFDVGALNEDVWERAVRENRVDQTKVRDFYTTPEYFDYNWTLRPDLDQTFGEGFSAKIQPALLKLNKEEHSEILELFSTERFIPSENENYQDLENVGRDLGMIK